MHIHQRRSSCPVLRQTAHFLPDFLIPPPPIGPLPPAFFAASSRAFLSSESPVSKTCWTLKVLSSVHRRTDLLPASICMLCLPRPLPSSPSSASCCVCFIDCQYGGFCDCSYPATYGFVPATQCTRQYRHMTEAWGRSLHP